MSTGGCDSKPDLPLTFVVAAAVVVVVVALVVVGVVILVVLNVQVADIIYISGLNI